MHEYRDLLEDEIFKAGEVKGRLRTILSMLTDMLIELNALEIFYQKPGNKSVAPSEIRTLRAKIAVMKELLHEVLQQPS